jgi:heme-degrading monooxygenase HmoA
VIVRMWKGRAQSARAHEYERFVTEHVFPAIEAIEGHRGSYLLQRAENDDVEFVVLTLWDSMEAIQRFAGAQTSRPVVEPEARAILSSFDDSVRHYALLYEKLH